MYSYKNKEDLEYLYGIYKSQSRVAEELNVNPKTVAIWMKRFEIQTIGSQGARKHFFNENFFKKIDSEDKAYWLGFIMADGCIYKGAAQKSLRLQINLKASDKKHLEKFQIAINSNYKIGEKKVRGYPSVSLKINSTKMCNDLINHNVIERKSIVCEFPEIQNYLIKHFIRGYFDGDGHCRFYKRNGLNKASLKLVGGLKMLKIIQQIIINETGISANIYPIKNSKVQSLEVSSPVDCYGIIKWLYENSSIYLDRKYELLNIAKEFVPFSSNTDDKTEVNC